MTAEEDRGRAQPEPLTDLARVVTRRNGPNVALVTGAASGIGQAVARSLADHGFVVAVNDLEATDELRALVREIGGVAYLVDVADANAIHMVVAEIERYVGPIEVAIANAGFLVEASIDDLDDALWCRTLHVLLGGAVNLIAACSPPMRERGHGSIVTISSELALVGAVEHAHYVAAKRALIGLSLSAARELAPSGIRVNVVAPGPTDTPLLRERWRDPSYLATIPLRRLGRPEEVADVIVATAAATWMTGQVVSPNGGTVIQ